MKRRPLLLLLLATVLASACAGTGGDVGRPPQPVLIVGTNASSPPYAFRRGGEIVGLEPDLAYEIGRDVGREIELVDLPWEDLLNMVARGRVDIGMAGITASPERAVRFAFSEPYVRAKLGAVVRRQDAKRFSSRATVCASPIDTGVIAGTTGEARLRSQCPAMIPRLYPTIRDAIFELNQNRIDGVVHDAPVLAWYASQADAALQLLPIKGGEESLAWALRPDDVELLNQVNASLVRMRDDGTLAALLARWIPESARVK
jgi:polar amino acid transport system substrate-binding protein